MMAESRNIFNDAQVDNSSAHNEISDSPAVSETRSYENSGTQCSKAFPNGADLAHVTAKIESLKKWTVTTYKTTKQSINEQLGKVKRTVDKDLEDRIEALRELQRRYQAVLACAQSYTNHFTEANNMQKNLAEAVYQLSCKEDVLNNEFSLHSQILGGMSQNGEIFVRALNNFISTLETVTEKSIQDTLLTIEHHDQARLAYDVHRCELEDLRTNPTTAVAVTATEEKCNAQKIKYEQLKEDVRIKLTLLEENRCKVMRRQIAILQNAFSAYFSGCSAALNGAVEEMNNESMNSSLHNNDPMLPSVEAENFPMQYSNNNHSSFLEK